MWIFAPAKFTALWLTQGTVLAGVSAFTSNVILAVIGGLFVLANTLLTLWWVDHEKREARGRDTRARSTHRRRRADRERSDDNRTSERDS